MKKAYQDYKNIIWLRLDSIGDAILSSSMLPHINERFSKATITVVCQNHVAELYKSCPVVHDIIVTPSEVNNSIFQDSSQYWPVINKIKAKNPDLLLNSVYALHHLSDL